jgi:hypothetical protein
MNALRLKGGCLIASKNGLLSLRCKHNKAAGFLTTQRFAQAHAEAFFLLGRKDMRSIRIVDIQHLSRRF